MGAKPRFVAHSSCRGINTPTVPDLSYQRDVTKGGAGRGRAEHSILSHFRCVDVVDVNNLKSLDHGSVSSNNWEVMHFQYFLPLFLP